jgi:hypothetical protein
MKMKDLFQVKARHVAAAMLAASLGPAVPSASAQDFSFTLRAGLACDFKLQVHGYGGNFHTEEFIDRNNNVVRMITAGKGVGLVFTNAESGAEFALKGNESVRRATINPDGSSTNVGTGHNVLVLSPADVPEGPSTTLHVGRYVYTVDASGIFSQHSATGASTDICAALSH